MKRTLCILAILALPPKFRAVIELRHFQEMSYEEMAEIIGITKSNVGVRISRAKGIMARVIRQTSQ